LLIVGQSTTSSTRSSVPSEALSAWRGRRVVGEQMQRSADQRFRVPKFLGHLVQALADRDALGARHQQAEGDRLGVAVGEGVVAGVRKKQLAPASSKVSQRLAVAFELFDDLVAKLAAQPRADPGQFLRGSWRRRLPLQKTLEQGDQALPAAEPAARGFDIAVEANDRRGEFAVLPQAEFVAVAVDQVGQRAQPRPLRLVVGIAESARVAALARRLQFDETSQGAVDRDRVIGPGLQIGERRFADRDHRSFSEVGKSGDVGEKLLKWRAQLDFGLATGCRIGQLGLRRPPESGDGIRNPGPGHPCSSWRRRSCLSRGLATPPPDCQGCWTGRPFIRATDARPGN
jgi:hypothetical protein